jgi:hypothetical protein
VTTPLAISDQLNRILFYLVEIGLAGDQNLTFVRALANEQEEVTFPKAELVTIALKDNRPYREIYETLVGERAYIVKMPDGAIILTRYLFRSRRLERHSLGFYPSPDLAEFQNNADIYISDLVYADVVAKNIVPFPVRFDFDCRPQVAQDIEHPISHQTLGQYKNCRIPVSAPLAPSVFFSFILRNFYNTAFQEYVSSLPQFNDRFEETITENEKRLVFIQIP